MAEDNPISSLEALILQGGLTPRRKPTPEQAAAISRLNDEYRASFEALFPNDILAQLGFEPARTTTRRFPRDPTTRSAPYFGAYLASRTPVPTAEIPKLYKELGGTPLSGYAYIDEESIQNQSTVAHESRHRILDELIAEGLIPDMPYLDEELYVRAQDTLHALTEAERAEARWAHASSQFLERPEQQPRSIKERLIENEHIIDAAKELWKRLYGTEWKERKSNNGRKQK